MYYMMASALEDEETQSKGIVLVVLNHSFCAAWKAICVPFWIARLQYCIVSPGLISTPLKNTESRAGQFVFIEVHAFCRQSLRSKLYMGLSNYLYYLLVLSSIVLGSLQKCLHSLMTYGTPSHLIPIHQEGKLKVAKTNRPIPTSTLGNSIGTWSRRCLTWK
jgi:hypothetical protein